MDGVRRAAQMANQTFLEELSRYFTWKRVPKSKLDEEYSNSLIEVVEAKPIKVRKDA